MAIVRLQGTMTCPPDNLAAAQEIFAKFIAKVESEEPGVLTYHYFVDDEDPLVIHVIEEYDSPESMLSHYAGLDGELVGQLLGLIGIGPMHYFGEPTPAEQEVLAGFGNVTYHRPLQSISREVTSA